jgi:hypothetical protein
MSEHQIRTEKLLEEIKEDLHFYESAIKEVSDAILDEGHSQYPVFVLHQHEVHAGELILDRHEMGRYWSVNATTVEELEQKGYLASSRSEDFKEVFKDPRKYMCLLLVTSLGGNIIFQPFSRTL